MFIGQYTYSLDAKGRVVIPPKYREELGEEFVISVRISPFLIVVCYEEDLVSPFPVFLHSVVFLYFVHHVGRLF